MLFILSDILIYRLVALINFRISVLICRIFSYFPKQKIGYVLLKLQPFQIEFTSWKEDQVQVIISGYRF